MKERGVDFILCPAYVGAAPLNGAPKYWNYTAIWNILDLPSAVLPSGLRCDRTVDIKEGGYTPRNEMDEEEWKVCKFLIPMASFDVCLTVNQRLIR